MATLETQYQNWLKDNEPIEYSEWLARFGEIHNLDQFMKDKPEYVIINKTDIQNRLEKLKDFPYHNGEQIYELEQVLANAVPLMPEIEKTFDSGVESVILRITNEDANTVGHSKGFTTRAIGEWVEPYPREWLKQAHLIQVESRIGYMASSQFNKK